MIVSEEYAKACMARYGLQTPAGGVAATPDDAVRIATAMGGTGVVKALVPTGGRSKAGGIKICTSVTAVRDAATAMLGHDLLGYAVEQVLVEELVFFQQEMYAGVVTNAATTKIDLLFSVSGGVDIETTARADSSEVLHMEIEPGDMLPVHRVLRWLRQGNAKDGDMDEIAFVLATLCRAAADLDAMLLEINPLALLEDGSLMALDCKLEIDDNALVRHPDLLERYRSMLSPPELRARELGVSYVPLDGNIGVITSGAGLGMATLDLLQGAGLSPANFLDTGGGISASLVQGALELILEPQVVQGAIINLYGGINRMLEAAQGIVAALEHIEGERPVVVKIVGNQQEEAWDMLEQEPNVYVIRVVQTEEAVHKLAELVG
jgi:succinyl-CoA synthetase beta subunit